MSSHWLLNELGATCEVKLYTQYRLTACIHVLDICFALLQGLFGCMSHAAVTQQHSTELPHGLSEQNLLLVEVSDGRAALGNRTRNVNSPAKSLTAAYTYAHICYDHTHASERNHTSASMHINVCEGLSPLNSHPCSSSKAYVQIRNKDVQNFNEMRNHLKNLLLLSLLPPCKYHNVSMSKQSHLLIIIITAT